MVCGGAGFIGSHLVERLLADGHAVEVVDDLSTGSLANLADARAMGGQLRFHHLDVTSLEFAELVGLRNPDMLYHFALSSASGFREFVGHASGSHVVVGVGGCAKPWCEKSGGVHCCRSDLR